MSLSKISPNRGSPAIAKVHNTRDSKQLTMELQKGDMPIWRRILLIRYYKNLGKFSDIEIQWSDFDKQNKVITVNDEKCSFHEALPGKLAKSTTRIIFKGKKLLTITLYYTTFNCLIQGIGAQQWLRDEVDLLKQHATQLKEQLKGNNSNLNIDKLILDIPLPTKFKALDTVNTVATGDLSDETPVKCVVNSTPDESTNVSASGDDDETFAKTMYDAQNEDGTGNASVSTGKTVVHEVSSGNDSNEIITRKVDKLESSLHVVETEITDIVFILREELKVIGATVNKMNDRQEKLENQVSKLHEKLDQMSNSASEQNRQMSREVTSSTNVMKTSVQVIEKNLESFEKVMSRVQSKARVEPTVSVKSNAGDGVIANEIMVQGNKMEEVDHDVEQQQDKEDITSSNRPYAGGNIAPLKTAWIIGSSVVNKLDRKKMYKNANRVHITTLHDKTIQGASTFIKSGKVKADVILYQVGSNELDSGMSPEQTIHSLCELIDDTRQVLGQDVDIIVSEVLPRWYSNKQDTRYFQNKCADYNNRLHSMSEELDIMTVKHNNIGVRNLYDGVHPNESGIRRVVSNYKYVLNEVLGVKSNTNTRDNARTFNTSMDANNMNNREDVPTFNRSPRQRSYHDNSVSTSKVSFGQRRNPPSYLHNDELNHVNNSHYPTQNGEYCVPRSNFQNTNSDSIENMVVKVIKALRSN